MFNRLGHVPVCAGLLTALVCLVGCGGGGTTPPAATPLTLLPGFVQSNLIADQKGLTSVVDPNLIDPRGVTYAPGGDWCVTDNRTSAATVYVGGNVNASIAMTNNNFRIPFDNPTGAVYNGTTDFLVTNGTVTAPATYLFASETGWITGWTAKVASAIAIAATEVTGAVYKGLAMGTNASGNFLFAANFSQGKVDVFDKDFRIVNIINAFNDPNIPVGFAPFGIQNINGTIYVSYAQQDAARLNDVAGPGNGYVDAFDTSGNFIKRIASAGTLNSPWGMAMAPASFGAASNMLLVGNFGDGLINVFSTASGTYVGTLGIDNVNPIAIPGLWSLTFGNGGAAGDTTSLYLTSGPGGETHGLFGRINAPAVPVVKHKVTAILH